MVRFLLVEADAWTPIPIRSEESYPRNSAARNRGPERGLLARPCLGALKMRAGSPRSDSLRPYAGQFDLEAGAHGRGEADALDVGSLGAGRFGAGQGVHQGLDVGGDGLVGEAGLAHPGVDDSGLLDP